MTLEELHEENTLLRQALDRLSTEKDKAIRTSVYLAKVLGRRDLQLRTAIESLTVMAYKGDQKAINTLADISMAGAVSDSRA